MDSFYEQLVVKKNRIVNDILYVLIVTVMIGFGLLAIISLNRIFRNTGFSIGSLLLTVVGFGGTAFLFYYKDEMRVEYEYAFTNGILDFAKVIANRKRKELLSLRIINIEACGPVSDPSFKRCDTMPEAKKIKCYLNPDSELYYIYIINGGVKQLITFEPDSELLGLIREANPQKVKVK